MPRAFHARLRFAQRAGLPGTGFRPPVDSGGPGGANARMRIRFPRSSSRHSEHDPAPIRVAILTGGSSGIGLGAALRFASEGWRVGLISRSAENLSALSLIHI